MASSETADSEAMHQVIAEIQELGMLDPAAREELLENLKQTDPKLWPLLTQQLRADLAWRQRAQEREMPPADPLERDDAFPASGGPLTLASRLALAPEAPLQGSPLEKVSRGSSDDKERPLSPEKPKSGQPSGEVVAASYESSSGEDWQASMEEAIRLLESDVARSPESDRDFAEQARLRMLYLVSNRRDEALRPIPSLGPEMQEFWSKQFYGLATLMDPELISDSGRRRAQARQHLDAAVSRLGESCPLVVCNLAFVTDVESYGSFKPFDKYQFAPGQRVLLYAEVENFRSVETAKGFHTATRSSYQIFDSGGKRVAEHESKPSEEYCRRPRRDFFVVYDFRVPQQIYPGKHSLQLTVADLNSEKIGQSLIEFTIKSSDG
ncbi:MAG: hypothetical protein ABIK89_11550 [Planctomycetota bacterium]